MTEDDSPLFSGVHKALHRIFFESQFDGKRRLAREKLFRVLKNHLELCGFRTKNQMLLTLIILRLKNHCDGVRWCCDVEISGNYLKQFMPRSMSWTREEKIGLFTYVFGEHSLRIIETLSSYACVHVCVMSSSTLEPVSWALIMISQWAEKWFKRKKQ